METSERTMEEFKESLHAAYPKHVPDVTVDIRDVFQRITRSRIVWMVNDYDDDNDEVIAQRANPHYDVNRIDVIHSNHSSNSTGKSIVYLVYNNFMQ